jgi:hypothetical protein
VIRSGTENHHRASAPEMPMRAETQTTNGERCTLATLINDNASTASNSLVHDDVACSDGDDRK